MKKQFANLLCLLLGVLLGVGGCLLVFFLRDGTLSSRGDSPEPPAVAAEGLRNEELAVLAAGAPEESFPPQLLTNTDADGNIRAVEPLAANIAAPTNAKRMKRLKTEHLRLAAAMLGCSYDSLYQRERRYRQRRLSRHSRRPADHL